MGHQHDELSMPRFDDYPYGPWREALGTLVGRLMVLLLVVLGGAMLGGVTSTRSLSGLWTGIVDLPGLSLASLLFGPGLLVLPALLVYAIVSIRNEWPLRLSLLFLPLMWWNVHKTIRWTVYDSPSARRIQQIQTKLNQGLQPSGR